MLRIAESCPRYPDLFTLIPPRLFTDVDLVFPMEQILGHMDYRTSILQESKTTDLVLINLHLYLAWLIEIIMVLASAFAWTIPFSSFVVYAINRKPAVRRLSIVVLLLKFMTAFTAYSFDFGYSPS